MRQFQHPAEKQTACFSTQLAAGLKYFALDPPRLFPFECTKLLLVSYSRCYLMLGILIDLTVDFVVMYRLTAVGVDFFSVRDKRKVGNVLPGVASLPHSLRR